MLGFKHLFASPNKNKPKLRSTTIQLSISSNYVSDWGIWEALRELSQNTLDHAELTGTKPVIKYHNDTQSIVFISNKALLSVNTLVLGSGTKLSDTEQRGQFGEGYKLALVVLLRLGIEVTIHNGTSLWIPKFEYSKQFETEVLTIEIQQLQSSSTSLAIKLTGITPEQANSVKQKVILDRSKSIGYQTSFGNILTEERFKGQVFVGGIYVCKPNIKLDHGYDFDASTVTLGRDRGLIDSFDIQWLASKMWAESATMSKVGLEETANLVTSGYAGTEYLGSVTSNQELATKVTEEFYSEYSENAVPVTTETERKTVLNSYDNAIPVIVTSTLKDLVSSSVQYEETKATVLTARQNRTPHEVITTLLLLNKNELGGSLYELLTTELVPASLNWVVAPLEKQND